MASAFTHAFISIPLGRAFFPGETSPRFWILSILCSVLPDADVIGFYFGKGYGGLWWHRGFTHSLFFAFFLTLAAVWLAFKDGNLHFPSRWKLWLFFLLLTCSHGILDGMTRGGYGVAFFSPFDTARYSLPWTPLKISPIGLRAFLSPWGKEVILNEITWVWMPAIFLWVLISGIRMMNSKGILRSIRRMKE